MNKINFQKIFQITFFLCFGLLTSLAAQTDTVKNYFANGNVESIILLSNGIREGESKYFYENGNPKEEIYYEAGVAFGSVKKYDSSGALAQLITLEHGRREGPASFFDSLGNFLKDIFYSQGKIVVEEVIAKDSALIEEENILATKNIPEPVKPPEKAKEKKSAEKIPDEKNNLDEIDDPAFFLSADIMPEPVIGWEAFHEKIIYPSGAREREIEGKVKIRAFINRDGDVEKTEIVEGIGWGCDDAVEIAVFYSKFKPGALKEKPVKIQMIIEHEFKLSSN